MALIEALTAYGDWGSLALRVALAAVFLYHGLPKLKSPGMMAKGMGFPTGGVALLGLVETLSALSLLLGVYPQLGAIGIGVVMLGALYLKLFKWKAPFSAMDKMGWEFDLVLLASALLVLLSDAGAYVLLS